MMRVCRGQSRKSNWRLQTAVTNGGYKRRLQKGSCVVSETEMKPKRNRNEDAAPGLGVRCPGPMCCAMVGGGVRGGVGSIVVVVLVLVLLR